MDSICSPSRSPLTTMEGGQVARRETRRWRTRFGSWVERVTVAGIQRELESAGHPVTGSAVYNWLSGETAPRLKVAVSLARISQGAVSLDDILAHREEVRDGNGEGRAHDGTGARPCEQ
jgi:hypothetical protein